MWFWESRNLYTKKQLEKWRGWTQTDINCKVAAGLLDIKVTDEGLRYAEKESESRKYARIPAEEPEEYEPIMKDGVLYFPVPRAAVQEKKPGLGFWGWFEVISTLILLPFTILGMREGTQWFLGTGKYGRGGGDDEW